MGLYAQCIVDIQTALQLDGHKSSALAQKLAPRLVKSYLQINDHKAAVDALGNVSEVRDKALLSSVCSRLANSLPDEHKYRRDRLEQLPKYLPSLDPVKEYYVVGHDEACSQIDASMLDQSDGPISILFGGIGDARNLYATLLKIDRLERELPRLPTRKYHITINDIKPETLARDLLMFFLLNDLGCIKDSSEHERRDILTTTFFLYIASVVPQRVSGRIQVIIDRVIAALQSKKGIPEWIHIYERDKVQLIKTLRSWRGNLKTRHTVAEVVRLHTKYLKSAKSDTIPAALVIERNFFAKTGACWASRPWAQQHEPVLLTVRADKKHWQKARTHVSENWRVNMTLMDEQWPEDQAYEDDLGSVLAFDPFDIMTRFYLHTDLEEPTEDPTIYAYAAKFFARVAVAMKRLQNRLVVEVIHGEISDILEAIRYRTLDRADNFPSEYDQVHLSNIPLVPPACYTADIDQGLTPTRDYIGGILTSVIFAMPVTKRNLHSAIASNCLLNTPLWISLASYYTEYLLLTEPEAVKQLMCIVQKPSQGDDVLIEKVHKSLCSLPLHVRQNMEVGPLREMGLEAVRKMSTETLQKTDLRSIRAQHFGHENKQYLSDYTRWCRSSISQFDYAALLPRASLQRWLCALFFKITLPVNRLDAQPSSLRVYSPINLTIFVRVFMHLKQLGYPAHWLSEVLEQLLEDRVITSARPPQTSPLKISEAQKEMPMKRLSTAPWIVEMATLAVILQPVLGFPLFTNCLPEPSSICFYTFIPTPVLDFYPNLPVYNLLFMDRELLKAATGFDATKPPEYSGDNYYGDPDIRRALHPEIEERGPSSRRDEHRALQEKGLTVITTFDWDPEHREATFWMNRDRMDMMKANGG